MILEGELLPGAEEWLSAFWALSTDRQIGMTVGPVPEASIDRWIDRNSLDDDDEDAFRGAIRAMDRIYLDHVDSKDEPGKAKSKPAGRKMSPALFDALWG